MNSPGHRLGICLFLSLAVWIGCGDDKSISPNDGPGFVYSDTEAIHLALQISPTFLPDTMTYKQVHGDLQLIRDSFPDMTKIEHFENRPAGKIIVQLTANAAAAFESGTYDGLDSLINLYDTSRALWTSQFRQLRIFFVQPYQPDSIASRFSLANGVDYSSAASIGGDSSRIFADPPQYEFQLRWENCLAGCDSIHHWHYLISGNSVELAADSGATLPDWF